eukprot:SM000041S15500  [mRNA]  locus=s41:479097:482666:- [translate_table: standard]
MPLCAGCAAACTESAVAGCLCAACSFGGSHRRVSKWIYASIFVVTSVAAWLIRDYSQPALKSLSVLRGCQAGHDCLGAEGVLRISLGLFVFFAVMCASTVGTKKTDDCRDWWHTGWWPFKLISWFLLEFLPFFIPSGFFQAYGELARIGAGIFLIIQLVSLLSFIYAWNESWLSSENERKCKIPVIVVAALCYLLSFIGIILMYVYFAPRAGCGLNIFSITWTLILIITYTAISLHPKVNAGLLTSGLISIYIVFLCYSAIMSEPRLYTCNTRHRQTGRGDWSTIIGFVLAIFAIILATFTSGIDSQSFSLTKGDSTPGDGDVPYGYGFFHFVFAMGSMYMAMLFLGWNLHQTQAKWSVDTGWVSVWVKIVNEWLAALLYIWTMVAPLLFKDRDFG